MTDEQKPNTVAMDRVRELAEEWRRHDDAAKAFPTACDGKSIMPGVWASPSSSWR